MIALNRQREHRGESMAYDEEAFGRLAQQFEELRGRVMDSYGVTRTLGFVPPSKDIEDTQTYDGWHGSRY